MAGDWVGKAAAAFGRILSAAQEEAERRLLRAGVLPNGLDVLKLQGPLWVHGTVVLATEDVAEGSTSLPVPMSQAHTLLGAGARLGTKPTGSAVAVTIYRTRGATASNVCSMGMGIGVGHARTTDFEDSAGRAGDFYSVQVDSEDSGGDAADLSAWLDVRVDVIRGTG